ncbi:dTMP kinase [Sphingomonas sp. URHD0057]|uniref:dTMP kinase n=1 Tax=Sphingomonas sp. URHD0057 TaxID=1380389 RepID=UPI00048CA9C6|nr:dTMP kinase [Sphingomonas sp. URHD0057]
MTAQGPKRGRFISLEGGEGVGKSTQVCALAQALQKRGLDVLITREPGGSDGAEKIRELLLAGGADRWSAKTEALLFAAARADHFERTIGPALSEGRWVISDRFVDSSLAYQGGAGGLGIEKVRELNAMAIESGFPDRTLILLLDEGGERARVRDSDGSDRIGGRGADYHHKVELAFRMIAAEEPERVKLVDASGAPQAVTERLLDAIQDLLP